MDNKDYRKFYLIREDVLPESVVKTLKVKDALKNNPELSIYDAVKQFNSSTYPVAPFINIGKLYFL